MKNDRRGIAIYQAALVEAEDKARSKKPFLFNPFKYRCTICGLVEELTLNHIHKHGYETREQIIAAGVVEDIQDIRRRKFA